jgi:hypothetical protein
MAMKAGPSESRHGEPLLQHEVVGVEANGDVGRCREAKRGGGVGTEMIAPDGEASVRAEVEDIATARRRPRGGAGKISRQQQWRREEP